MTRIEQAGETLAFLVASSEPIDWKRTSLEVLHTKQQVPKSVVPGPVKLTDVSFEIGQSGEESVTLLLREDTDLSGYRVEHRRLPLPFAEPTAHPVLFAELFDKVSAKGAERPSAEVTADNDTRTLGRWIIRDQGTIDAPSAWRVSAGALSQSANIYSEPVTDYRGTYAITGDSSWTDYRLIVRMCSDDDDAIGVIFRYVDEDNCYLFVLDAQRNYRRLVKKTNGDITVLWEDDQGFTVGMPFTLTVEAAGARLVGHMDGTRLFALTDASHQSGQIGLYCWGNTGARFERVEVRRPSLESYALWRDHFSEFVTSDWSVIDEGTEDGPSYWMPSFDGALNELGQFSNIHSTPLSRDVLDKKGTQAVIGDASWTDIVLCARLRSLDDDAIGLLFRFVDENNYYRFSMDNQRGYRRLVKNADGHFSLLWEDDFAYEIGRTYEVVIEAIGGTLRGHIDGVPMFVAEDEDTTLTAGRIGLYCWADHNAFFSQIRVYPAERIFSDWLLDEPFYTLHSDRWSFVDEGEQQAPSRWDVIDGELRQLASISDGSAHPKESNKAGTYALGGAATWADYRVSVRLISDDPIGAIGVMFRYQDADNYYRFSMDRQCSCRRLVKKVAGNVTVLWEDTIPYIVGREYLLTLQCIGAQLIGYLDGVPLFSREDIDISAGRIGLYCWANKGARFVEVRVVSPIWASYYAFANEEQLRAGTRIQVIAGSAIDRETVVAGTVRRFSGSLSEHGRPRLPARGADLRLVSPNEIGGHRRRFLPDSMYKAITGVRLLRKADGTGFFVTASDRSRTENRLAPGQYRLKMAFRRENTEIERESQILSECGKTTPELTTLDIPQDTPFAVITEQPAIWSINPVSGRQGETLDCMITGVRLVDAMSVTFSSNEVNARILRLGDRVANIDQSADTVFFSPDGRLVAMKSDGRIGVYEASTGKELTSMIHNPGGGGAFSLSRNWHYEATWIMGPGHPDRTLSVHDISTDVRILWRKTYKGWVTAAAFDLSERYLIVGTYGSQIGNFIVSELTVYEVSTGREVVRSRVDTEVTHIAFSSDELHMAVARSNNPIMLWRIDEAPKPPWRIIPYAARSAIFSPDATLLAAASNENTPRIWNVRSGEEITQIKHEGGIAAIVFSPDGRYLATAGNDHTARIWHVPTGDEVARMEHESPVQAIAISPDSRNLATTDNSRVARVWEVVTGIEVARMEHEGPQSQYASVKSITFSPDGHYLATGGWHYASAVWAATPNTDTRLPLRIAIAGGAPIGLQTFRLTTPHGVADSQDAEASFMVRVADESRET